MKKRNVLALAASMMMLTATAQSTARKFTMSVSDDGQAILTGYLPQTEKATGRAVVICPGGAYWAVAENHEGHDWSEYFNSQGIACFVLKYRLPKGNRNIPIGDAKRAMKTVRDSADVWHVNPYDVGIMGSSAGGHLASTISTHTDLAYRPNFTILFYPVISLDGAKGHVGSAKNLLGKDFRNPTLIKQYSNHLRVRGHATPPAIILMSSDDLSVPPVTNGVAYYSAMRSKGNNCAMYIYPTGGHGWGFNKSFKFHDEMLANLTGWLNQLPSPAKDAVRVACIGNSITDGSGIDMRERYGYPARLQEVLGKGYNVKNFGVGARTMLNKGNYPYMKEPAWRDALDFQPNVAVIKLGTNDSKAVNWQYKDEFATDMQQMIDSLKALPTKPKIYLALPLVCGMEVKSDQDINNTTIEEEVIPIIRKLAKKNKCTLIDMREDLNKPELMLKDKIHPNAKGTAVMARKVAEAISSK